MRIFLNMLSYDLFQLVHVQFIWSLDYKQFDKVGNKYEAHLPHVMKNSFLYLHVTSVEPVHVEFIWSLATDNLTTLS